MNNKNQDDITNAELAKLIESVAVNLVSLQEKVTAFQENVEQRFENVEERFDKIEGRLDRAKEAVVTKTYLDVRLEKIERGIHAGREEKCSRYRKAYQRSLGRGRDWHKAHYPYA